MSMIFAAALLAAVSAKAPAGFSSGDLLFSDCNGSRQFVTGYVTGWLDKWNRDEYLARRGFVDGPMTPRSMVDTAYFSDSVGINFCIPATVTTQAIGDLLCEFLTNNPETRDATGDDIMTTLFRGRFSCGVK